MGPGKYENVGKSQPDLIVINPILSPRTRINRHARGTPPSSAVRVGGGGGGASQIRNGRGESWVSWVQLFIASWKPGLAARARVGKGARTAGTARVRRPRSRG
jgi:hypothetical protein